jgi:DnaB-like helicase C terminal domain/Toprim-like
VERERKWLHARGINDKTIQEAGLVFHDGKIKIPYRINGKEVGYQVRCIDKKEFKFNEGFTPTVYVPTGNYNGGYAVWVTEGAMDALILHQLGYPAIAIPSASTFATVSNLPFRDMVLALDNDEPGELACKNIAALGLPGKLFRVKYQGKDPNECVLANGGKFPHEIVPYIPGGIKHIRDVHCNGNISSSGIVAFDNGMPTWNAGDLVVLFGQEKSGKSSTMLSIIAKASTVPTLLESYEMLPERVKDWYSKMGGTDAAPLYITTEFGEFRWHDIMARINSGVNQLGIKMVVIDHILFLTGNDDNVTNKLAEVTRQLKLLAMKFKIVIVALAHETDGRIYGSRMMGANADHILHLRRMNNSVIIEGVHRYNPKASYEFPIALGGKK